MNKIQDDLIAAAALEMSRQIDFEVYATAMGWVRVELPNFYSREQSVDIVTWIADNVEGHFHQLGSSFIFELDKDADMVILRWA